MGGDVLTGSNAVWEFGADALLIRYDRGLRTPKLLHVLRERRIPYEALSGVDLVPGRRRGTVVLRASPRPGADPLAEAASGQLKEAADPYGLVLPADRERHAEHCAGELRTAIGAGRPPARRFLVAAPGPPRHFKAYDAKASFDGRAVVFRLFWSGAATAKWKAGDQRFPVADLAGVEWRSPELGNGCLRLLVRDDARHGDAPRDPAHDPASVVFKMGYGLVHESLPFAASVLEAIGSVNPAAPPGAGDTATDAPGSADGSPRREGLRAARDRAGLPARIRRLGKLHRDGLLPDDEFTARRSDLLADM